MYDFVLYQGSTEGRGRVRRLNRILKEVFNH